MNIYFQEIVDAHQLIMQILSTPHRSEENYRQLIARFSDQFSMITTTGVLLDYEKIKSFINTQFGSKQGLKIDILDMKIVSENENYIIVLYQEKQQIADGDPNFRFSTVIFKQVNNQIIWEYLHETLIHDF
ncbi:nuclear transport factor 2 family protein [Acinetobacter nectaris]|uniref:nuclear transport factor 2 family protein n=1 Tax=Acinetobacter nectaris TaxID=1219382 RepID=UPI001F32CE21|nr:nuclear transport factor 2 family protein [Acinetobacter nectaris]MCF9000173.1 hypothetical protein [Acinetobacter nectaris]MCF9028331.1 hypothetical protein [Acinetobacter nectaris]